ncbi:hypothetical protein POTOM_016687 [Populus tomentosa]|uniref:peroxidase n=1 Tax=Populus tomentosa TaxID=118781 RepID=A0A8X7ZWA1_POPTO|nr:hypothetical protein POTOM_016687 [Populus tomentosa]
MDSLKLSSGLIFIQLVLLAFVFNSANAQLKVGFYKDSCPQAEAIVKGVMDQVLKVAPSLSGPLLRLHFHDCFVRTLGPSWRVETGRRDGRVSNFSEPLTNLPPFFANISQLLTQFRSKNLSKKDLVVLSGAHTIGTSHCSSFDSRLYNFTGKGDTDPTLDSEYITRLKKICKAGDQITLVEMDPGGARTFDTSYYKLVANRRALFQSDAALLDNIYTKAYVKLQSVTTDESTFFKDFGVSMRKMGRVEVLTGKAGEIRKVCSKVN